MIAPSLSWGVLFSQEYNVRYVLSAVKVFQKKWIQDHYLFSVLQVSSGVMMLSCWYYRNRIIPYGNANVVISGFLPLWEISPTPSDLCFYRHAGFQQVIPTCILHLFSCICLHPVVLIFKFISIISYFIQGILSDFKT